MSDTIEIKVNVSLIKRNIERIGPAYLNSKRNNLDLTQNPSYLEKKTNSNDEPLVDIDYLKSLDPKEWKNQDHYAVLGLRHLRHNATDDDIRRSYRKMVLQHHPDKRNVKEKDFNVESDYFTCITKAYEILGTPKTRRSYDSVDPEFDDSLPTPQEIEDDFYGALNKCFYLNGRWSERKDVPEFGDANSTREKVETFYTFWYDFKSWREFSYLDEEDKEKGQDRDERRWIEKENKAARIKRKKEEMLRIRALVDLAYNNDKRIQKFKMEDKEKKLAAKKAKINVVQAQKAEQERALREAQLAKENAEKAEKKRLEKLRIEKEINKKVLRKERKCLRDKAKENNYFVNNDDDRNLLTHIEGVEKICEKFNLTELQALNKQLTTAAENNSNSGLNTKDIFLNALAVAESKIKAYLDEANQLQNNRNSKNTISVKQAAANTTTSITDDVWASDNVQLLTKAVNLFPAGTPQRWDVIATFINQHSVNDMNVSAQDVLKKAKALQNSDFSQNFLKHQVNARAFESFANSKKDIITTSDITINTDGCLPSLTNQYQSTTERNYSKSNTNSNLNQAVTVNSNSSNNRNNTKMNLSASGRPWTKEEQACLEQAIKTYSTSTPDRWDRIAECVPNRTKKDCLRRVKELVELVNAKKEGQNK